MSITRTIKRNIAKKNGTFIAQKPLRQRGTNTFMSMIMAKANLNKTLKAMKIKKEDAESKVESK